MSIFFSRYIIFVLTGWSLRLPPELPQQILPTAQRLLDELLSGAQSLEINTVSGAPDPTAGGSVGEQSAWCLDSKNLRDNIKKILIKVCRGKLPSLAVHVIQLFS